MHNSEFIQAIFGEDAPCCHVTDFPYDPGDIPQEKHLVAWKGDYFSRYKFGQDTNQYFTVSCFDADEHGVARRRKALYRNTRVIVLDDVREKLSMTEVSKLPLPSWILETSLGSEQWGYILSEPCTDRSRVENLLDGLVANGLAPGGKDPGMKGVTRYVRLPDGVNTKADKRVDGKPFKCRMVEWSPFNTVTLEQLASPFNVDLDAVRREARVDGAASVSDHPLLQVPEIVTVKEVRSDGRFDITCPWVEEHTGGDDSGTAVFTNADGSIGFKCHHGNCQDKTGKHLLDHIEGKTPGFGARLASWQSVRVFADVSEISFMCAALPPVLDLEGLLNELRRHGPSTPEAREHAGNLLKVADGLPKIDQVVWHDSVCDVMGWSKTLLREILRDLRDQWYVDSKLDCDFYNDCIYVGEQNRFFNHKTRVFHTPDGFQNRYGHLDPDARKSALTGGLITKVDKIDYAPKQPRTFTEGGIIYGNTWDGSREIPGVEGDVTRWLNHWDVLGWGDHRDHMLKWMATTIEHPDRKINHALLLGSGEGGGKDFLLYPLMHAMDGNSDVISGDDLLGGFSDYVLSTKYLHINEVELGDRKEAVTVSNKLKPLAAAPPLTLRANIKGVTPVKVRNILSVSMATNSQMPIRVSGTSRRIFAVWSDINTRDEHDEMTQEWRDYWAEMWTWMENGGVEACVWYMRNCVDLEGFNPAQAPPMTEFLRDIKESSKSAMQQTVEALIKARVGAFKSDLVTSGDAARTLRAGELSNPDLIYCDVKAFTPVRVGQIFKELGMKQMRARKGAHEHRICVIRSPGKYSDMGPAELMVEYDKQLQQARTSAPMEVVN